MIIDKRYVHIYKSIYARKSVMLILLSFIAFLLLILFMFIFPGNIVLLILFLAFISLFAIFAAAHGHYAFEVLPDNYKKLRRYINLYGKTHVRKSYLLVLLGFLAFTSLAILLYYAFNFHSLYYIFQWLLLTVLFFSIFSVIAGLPGYSGLEIEEATEKNSNSYAQGLEKLKFLSIIMSSDILTILLYLFFRREVLEIFSLVLSILSLFLMFSTFSSLKNVNNRYAIGLTGVKSLIISMVIILFGLLWILLGLIVLGFIFLTLGILLATGGTIFIGISIHRLGVDLKSRYFKIGSIMTIVPVLDFFGWIVVLMGTRRNKMSNA